MNEPTVDVHGAVVPAHATSVDAKAWSEEVCQLYIIESISGTKWDAMLERQGDRVRVGQGETPGQALDLCVKWANDRGLFPLSVLPASVCSERTLVSLPVCDHPSTFDCHGNPRCETCHMDALVLKDGTLLWPSQDDPMSWNAERIGTWFLDNRICGMSQGCDGFTFARNNLNPGGALYGYVWSELYLDLDLAAAWMLDVRRHDEQDERRQYLFVGCGYRSEPRFVWHDQVVKFRDDNMNRTVESIRWFATQVDLWLAAERSHDR